jgi:hypothetical protein
MRVTARFGDLTTSSRSGPGRRDLWLLIVFDVLPKERHLATDLKKTITHLAPLLANRDLKVIFGTSRESEVLLLRSGKSESKSLA